jgi:hypothetical protein
MNLAFPDSDHPILARAIMAREAGNGDGIPATFSAFANPNRL